jgi:hypothetical protein
LGARVDLAWTAEADAARTAVGRALEVVLDEEDTVVPTLARQLGLPRPTEPLDFDVSFRGAVDDGPCDSGLPRRLYVTTSGTAPTPFFACVLGRAFERTAPESEIYRAILAAAPPHGEAAERARDRLYACIVRYAVATVLLATPRDRRVARAIERGLGESCSPPALDWMGREWVKRVREDEGAAAFGARAAREAEASASP